MRPVRRSAAGVAWGACAAGSSAISAISFLTMAWPNELKSSATITNAPGPPIDVGPVVVRKPAGRIGVLGIPGHRPLAQDHQSVDGDACGDRLVAGERDVAAGIVGAVARHVDGAARRLVGRALQHAPWRNRCRRRSRCARRTSAAVRPAGRRISCAASAPSIMVQSISTFCELTPDHSTKATAMRLLRPGGDRLEHPLVGDRGGVAFALKLELGLIDAARNVGGEHQQQIDLFGGCARRRHGAEQSASSTSNDRNARSMGAPPPHAAKAEPSGFPAPVSARAAVPYEAAACPVVAAANPPFASASRKVCAISSSCGAHSV